MLTIRLIFPHRIRYCYRRRPARGRGRRGKSPAIASGKAADGKWKVGAINGAPYIGAALIGCWLSDPLNHWFGRRGEIFITSIILILTPIGSAFSQNWYQLFAIRLVLGIGMGAKAATVPMYAAELSPAVVRGALVMGWQLWTAFGIFIGTCANAVVKDVSPPPKSRVALTPRSRGSHGDSSLDPLSSPPSPSLLVSTSVQSLLDGI